MSDLIRLNPDGLRLVRSNVDGMEIGGWPTEIGEVMNGTRAGRTRPDQVTLFESQGMAIQDLIIAAELAKMARAQGLGTEVDVGG